MRTIIKNKINNWLFDFWYLLIPISGLNYYINYQEIKKKIN